MANNTNRQVPWERAIARLIDKESRLATSLAEYAATMPRWDPDSQEALAKMIQSERRIDVLRLLEDVLPELIDVLISEYTINGKDSSAPEPETVGQAIDAILKRGPARYSAIRRMIESEFEKIDVLDMDRSVSAALHYGVRAGKYRRLERGVYKLVED